MPVSPDLHIRPGHHVVDLRDMNADRVDVGAIRKAVRSNASQRDAGMIANEVVDAGLHGWQIDALPVLWWQRLTAAPAHRLSHSHLPRSRMREQAKVGQAVR